MKATELWHNKERSWLESTSIPDRDGLVLRSLYSLVSTGTERIVTTHPITAKTAKAMAVPYMKGTLEQAFTYGYSLVGEVMSAGDLQGQFVHVMHPHQDVLLVDQADVTALPEGLDPKLGTLISNMETVVNAIWDAQIELGDRVLVQGYGIIGALLASVLQRYPGVSLCVNDIEIPKQKRIAAHGYQPMDDAQDFDVVFNTTSSEQALQDAFRLTRLEGTIVEMSWYGGKQVSLDLGADFHYGRKRMISSQVSHIPIRKKPMWGYKDRKELVLKLLLDLNPEHLLEKEVAFHATPAFFDALRSGKIKDLSTIINYY